MAGRPVSGLRHCASGDEELHLSRSELLELIECVLAEREFLPLMTERGHLRRSSWTLQRPACCSPADPPDLGYLAQCHSLGEKFVDADAVEDRARSAELFFLAAGSWEGALAALQHLNELTRYGIRLTERTRAGLAPVPHLPPAMWPVKK